MATLRGSKLRALQMQPYTAAMVMSLKLKQADWVPTAGVTKRGILYYNPSFWEELTPAEGGSIILHEAWHILRGHHDRMGNREELRWNIATDMEINDSLPELPEWAVTPEKADLPEGKLAEWYYEHIPEQITQAAVVGMSSNSNSQYGKVMAGGGELWDEDDGPIGDLMREAIAKQVAHDIKEYAKRRGTVPAELERWADEILNPRIDWRKELAAAVKHAAAIIAGRTDYSYRKSSRRSSFTQVIMPRMVGHSPRVAVVIDTSGSISQEELNVFMSELKGILDSMEYPVRVIVADAEIHSNKLVRSLGEVTLTGGGGTDMTVGIAAAKKEEVIIVFTDGYTPWPEPGELEARLIAVVTTGVEVPEWIKTIRFKMD